MENEEDSHENEWLTEQAFALMKDLGIDPSIKAAQDISNSLADAFIRGYVRGQKNGQEGK